MRKSDLDLALHAQTLPADDRYRALLENAYWPLALVNPVGVILRTNGALLRACGGTSDEVLGRPLWELPGLSWLAKSRGRLQSAIARAVEGAPARSRVALLGGPRGSGLEFSILPLIDDVGRVSALLVEGCYLAGHGPGAPEHEQRGRFRLMFASAAIGMALAAPDGSIVQANRSFCQVLGYQEGELLGRKMRELLHPEDRDASLERERRLVHERLDAVQREQRYLRKDGREIWCHWSASAIWREDGTIKYFIEQLQDITEKKVTQRMLEEREQRYRGLVESLQEGVILQSGSGEIIGCNKSAERILGLGENEITGRQGFDFGWPVIREDGSPFSKEDLPTTLALTTGVPQQNVVMGLQRFADDPSWLRLSAIPLFHEGRSSPYAVVTSFTDITPLRRKEKQLEQQAFIDPLTSLPNRRFFFEALRRARKDQERTRQVTDAVMYLDLDRFKSINDEFGHAFGDEVLIEVARRLKESARPGDVVARLGGDEFAVLFMNVQNAKNVVKIARRLLNNLDEPMPLGEGGLKIAAGIGISVCGESDCDPDELVNRASLALRRAKVTPGVQYVIYDEDLDAEMRHFLGLEKDLRQALSNGELHIYYQPIIDLETRGLSGAEALLRWKHPTRGFVSPGDFIPVAEETGIIHPIGEWVLRHSLRHLRGWLEVLPSMRLSINVSPRQLESPHFLEMLKGALGETGVEPGSVVLELTETYVMQRLEERGKQLRDLAALGVGLAIDDFGTGYSSLTYLQHLPITHVKIDRSFLREVPSEVRNKTIIRAIFALANTMELTIVAEGIERDDQELFLRDLGCRLGQGFLYRRPVPLTLFSKIVKDRKV